jgi:septum formation protein
MLALASASSARSRLLNQAGILHQIHPSGVAEDTIQDSDPSRLVQRLARAKAKTVHGRLIAIDRVIQGVLGCDSVLVVDGIVYGKPADEEDAIARWRRLAGGWGDLLTGHCLLRGLVPGSQRNATQQLASEEGAGEWLTTVTTRVYFASLSQAEIEAYVATGEPLQCAGGFAMDGRGGLLVERIEGCYSNVIGLSLPLMRRWLRELHGQ